MTVLGPEFWFQTPLKLASLVITLFQEFSEVLVSMFELQDNHAIKTSWEYSAQGVIWRIMPADIGVFVGEERDLKLKRASFFCVSKVSGDILWEGVCVDEPWWIGMEAVHKDRLILHGFATPDMPGHRGMVALDLGTGRATWTSPNLRFLHCHEDSVFASEDTPAGTMVYELDYRTGELKHVRHDQGEVPAHTSKPWRPTEIDHQLFPTPIDLHDGSQGTLNNILRTYCPMDNVVGPVEVVTIAKLLIFSYYERKNKNSTGTMKHTLNVVDLHRSRLMFMTVLDGNVQNPVPDAFFVEGETLYFIRNKSMLVAMNLGKS